jgi:hypothetical protein
MDAVFDQTFQDFEVILVDNGSVDDSVPFIRSTYPRVRLLVNDINLGFAAGNNQAIRASRSPFVATLNNDTQVEPDWLEALVNGMKMDENIGMCASKMLFAHRRDMINSAGICMDRAGIAWDRKGGELDDVNASIIEPVFGACAGAALYRREMLNDVGLFDEDFFAYLEDVDLAWRAQLAGWDAIYVPQARVYHHHSGTSGERSSFKSRHLGRNKAWTILKNYPAPYIFWYLPIIILYDVASVGYALLGQRNWASLYGRWMALRRIPEMLRKRHRIQGQKRVSSKELMRAMHALISPWRIPDRYAHLKDYPIPT